MAIYCSRCGKEIDIDEWYHQITINSAKKIDVDEDCYCGGTIYDENTIETENYCDKCYKNLKRWMGEIILPNPKYEVAAFIGTLGGDPVEGPFYYDHIWGALKKAHQLRKRWSRIAICKKGKATVK